MKRTFLSLVVTLLASQLALADALPECPTVESIAAVPFQSFQSVGHGNGWMGVIADTSFSTSRLWTFTLEAGLEDEESAIKLLNEHKQKLVGVSERQYPHFITCFYRVVDDPFIEGFATTSLEG